MIYIYALAALLGLWFFRRYLLSPWATYVSHSQVGGDWFLTVKRVRCYPPFLSYEERWHSGRADYHGVRQWGRESDGATSWHNPQLTSIFEAALARDEETDRLCK